MKSNEYLNCLHNYDFNHEIAARKLYIYENPQTGERYIYTRTGYFVKDGVVLRLVPDATEAEKRGLWENIRRKKERMGKNYKPAKTVKEGRPTQEQLKRAQSDKDMSYCNCGKPDQVGGFTCKQHCENKSEALQRGKPGPNDPRKTPAPKKDRKKGSKKNKPDSAKDDKGKITFSKKTVDRLKKKMEEHNKKGKGSKATLGALKAVYRRGAGAFSTSHAPKMSRDGWAMARVNAFLYLLRNGKPSNPNYKQDNDLLPKGHPRSSKK